jgi:IS605 OrfB family transposase
MALNMKVVQKYNADVADVLKGKRTLSNYRLGMPIPFATGAVGGFRKIEVDKKEEYKFVFVKGIEFNVRFGKDKSDHRSIVDRVFSGEYKFCDSEIKIDDKKMFLFLTVQLPKTVVKLDYNKYAATNLGMNCPVFLTTTDGHKKSIGTKEEFWAVRTQMQSRYTKLQASLTTAKAGHGRTRKLKALDRLQAAEKGFATTYNHKLSKEIVLFCVNNGIGNIKTEDLLGAGKTLNKQIILRNWSYFQLQSFIDYKAKMYNVNVIKPDPANITQKCNCCKNVSRKAVDLKDRVYKCVNPKCANFAKPVDIDENASLNLLETEVKQKEKAEVTV